MKKLILTTLTLLTCGTAFALPLGNPCDACLLCDGIFREGHCGDPCDPCLTWCDAFSVRIGFYGDYVFNHHMEIDRNEDNSDLDYFKMNTNAGYVAGNFWDRLDIFATFGTSNFYIDTNNNAFITAGDTRRLELWTETDFSWSVGGRGTLWECGCTCLGVEFQYFYTKPDVKRITIDGVSEYPDNFAHAKYREWQLGLGISHRINILAPYIGIKWSHAKIDFNEVSVGPFDGNFDVTLYNLETSHSFGYAVGVSLVECEKMSLTIEGRFANETAVHVNGQIRY